MGEKPPKRYRLGVLFVHGIGQQPKGDTLVRWGEAILAWIEAAGASGDPATAVEVSAARVTGDDSRAARAEVEVSRAGAAPERWLFCEAWWATAFATPSFGRLLSWSVHIVPWSIVLHFARSFDRGLARAREAPSLPRQVGASLGLAFGSLTALLAGVLLAPALVLLLALLLLVGLLPVPRLRSFVAAAQRVLAGSVGDSLVLLESPIQAAAMRSRVRDELGRMARQCEQVAVVAHSQGAAIACQALSSVGAYQPPEEVKTLVTFGSGVNKLELLARLGPPRRTGGKERDADLLASPWAASLLLAALVGLGLWICAQLAAGALHAADFLRLLTLVAGSVAVPPLALGLRWLAMRCRLSPSLAQRVAVALSTLLGLGLIAVLARRIHLPLAAFTSVLFYAGLVIAGLITRIRRTETEIQRTPPASVERWLDLWATADPVPNGPTLGGAPGRPTSVAVHNGASMLRDHTAYWSNREEFVARMAAVLLETADGPSAVPLIPEADLERAGRRRGARLVALRITRWVLSLATAVYLARSWGSVVAAGGWVLEKTSPALDKLSFDPTPWVEALGLPRVLGVALVLGTGLATYGLALAGSRMWEAAEVKSVLASEPASMWPPLFFGVLVTALVSLAWLAEPSARATLAAIRGQEVPASEPSLTSLWFLVLGAGWAVGWLLSKSVRRAERPPRD